MDDAFLAKCDVENAVCHSACWEAFDFIAAKTSARLRARRGAK